MRKTATAVGAAALVLTAACAPIHTVHSTTSSTSSWGGGSSGGACEGYVGPQPSDCPALTTTTTEAPLPTPADFSLQVIEMSRNCFGDAGCNVEYRIVPTYNGPEVPTGSFTLLYELDGGDDTQTGNIEMRNGRYNTEQGFISTSYGTLTAHVTQILED